uniref:Receptor-type adenylate cyclase GRESAG 4.3 n=1 Tax=Lygus hesperus TaxID=30085 RepID=A0A0A9XWK9_LYGHE
MDVLEDAIYDFSEVLEFFEEWKSALGVSTKDLEGESLDRYLFLMTLKRHVGIARKLMIDLYNCFDVYVIEKNRNPFVVKRPGKRSKKLRFGRRQYKIQVEIHDYEIFPLFQETTEKSFTKKELEVVNKLYNGTLKICRLQSFMDDVKYDEPSEKGDQVTVEVTSTTGTIVRGLLTYSPNGSTEKEIKEHLDVTHSCKNMCGVEMHFIGDVEFGLKLVLAKLKRMKSPYVTPIQNVVKLDEVDVRVGKVITETASIPQDTSLAVDIPPEGATLENANTKSPDERAIGVGESGRGDAPLYLPVVGWKGMKATSDQLDDKFYSPFSEHPQPYDDSDSDVEAPSPQVHHSEKISSVKIPFGNSQVRSCTIQ